MFGFLNINKPKGITSHDVISMLRKITNIRQIGHTGTLDPFATGVLPICIGKATRLIEYLNEDKAYIATIQFGKNTDSYDIDGNITEEFEKKTTEAEVLKALEKFKGEILQTPPIYSALKVNGKKLYEYARAGQNIEIKQRKVNIYNIELKSFDINSQVAQIYVACSKGTYIRSIAYDIGELLETGAFLSELQRVQAGAFKIETSLNLENLTIEEVKENLINPISQLEFPIYNLNEIEKQKVSHGMSIKNTIFSNSDIVNLVYRDNIYAIGQVQDDKIIIKKVFEIC